MASFLRCLQILFPAMPSACPSYLQYPHRTWLPKTRVINTSLALSLPLKIDYTLRCLDYIYSIIITIKTTRALDTLVPIGLLLVKTLTTVLTYRLSRSNVWNGKQSIHIWYTYKVVLAMVVHVYV